MARSYGRIVRKTWRSPRFRKLKDDTKLLLCYLWTCQLGETCPYLFYATKAMIADDLGWSERRLRIPFRDGIDTGFYQYHEDSRMLFFPRQMEFDPPANPGVIKSVLNRMEEMPNNPFIPVLCQQLKAASEKFKEPLSEPYSTQLADGIAYGVDIPQPYPIPNPQPKPEPDPLPKCNVGKPDDARPYAEIVSDLNEVCDTNFKPTTNKTRELISARIKEGFTVDDFKTVHRKKADEWKNNPEFSKFLRPETLYGTKFESYLNQKIGVRRLSEAGERTRVNAQAWLREQEEKDAANE